MAWFEHNNSRIYYDEHGEGDPVLLLPGFSQEGQDLPGVIDALSSRYHGIAADLPGSGQSQPQPRRYTPDFYREDAKAMAALLAHLGTGPAHILGFSDGGEVALLMAVQNPEVVRSLLVWGAAGTLGEGDLLPMVDMMYNMIDTPPDFMRDFSQHLKERYGEDIARATTRSNADTLRAIMEAGGDISLSRVSEIKCPTLIMSGEHDPFSSPPMSRELASRIPNAELIQVPGVGHDIHDERPEWFTQTMLDWLGKL